jgi:hypothetical protein
MRNKKQDDENLLVILVSCVMAIIGVMTMRVVLKLDFQSWALIYIAAASTAAVRWTMHGANLSVWSILRAAGCLMIGLTAIQIAGYPGAASFHTASLVPREIADALGYFHVFYDK